MDSSPVPAKYEPAPPPARGYPPGYGYPAAPPEPFDEGGGLLEYWHILRRRKGTVLLIAFSGLLLGILVTLPQTPVYQARTSLEIQDINQDFMNLKQVNPVSESSSINALSDMQTQIKILQSELLADRTIAKLKAAPAGEKLPETRISAWRNALNLPESTIGDPRENMLKRMAKSVTVRAAGQTRMIEILVESIDPKLAASFANTLASEFIDQNIQARWDMSRRTSDWLGQQLDDMRIKLERSEEALQTYARKNNLMYTGSGDKENVSEEKLRQLQTELSKAHADRVAKQSRYEVTRTASAETLPDVLNDSNLRSLQASLTDLRRQEAELAATFKPDYSKSKKVRAQIESLESALERERKAIVDRIGNDYEEAQRREKLLSAAYGTQSHIVTGDAERSVQYNILKREVDTSRQIYEAMLQRVKESSIASAMKASNVRVVDFAKPPEGSSKPNIAINAAFGLFTGAFLGIGIVVMRERTDRTIQAPGDMSYWLGLPELGVIPNDKSGRHRIYHRRTKVIPPLLAEPSADRSNLLSQAELARYEHRDPFVSEAFRSVLTSIVFTGENGGGPRVLVVTSAVPGEGKTTIAANLAIAFAEIHQRVLLIDADLRQPRVHNVFSLDNLSGLSNVLGRRGTHDIVVLAEAIQPTAIHGLSVLTSGPTISGGENLLFSSNMSALLATARKQFDIVLIDTPPMLQMPDARVLGRMADGVILVARAAHTTREAVKAAGQRLADDNTRVIGTVLNDWNSRMAPYEGYAPYSKTGTSKYQNAEANPGVPPLSMRETSRT